MQPAYTGASHNAGSCGRSGRTRCRQAGRWTVGSATMGASSPGTGRFWRVSPLSASGRATASQPTNISSGQPRRRQRVRPEHCIGSLRPPADHSYTAREGPLLASGTLVLHITIALGAGICGHHQTGATCVSAPARHTCGACRHLNSVQNSSMARNHTAGKPRTGTGPT